MRVSGEVCSSYSRHLQCLRVKRFDIHGSFAHKGCSKSPACAYHQKAQYPPEERWLWVGPDGRTCIHNREEDSVICCAIIAMRFNYM
jgi:hypothetical protein